MQRRSFLLTTLGAGGGVLLPRAGRAGSGPLQWRERALLGLGTTLQLRAAHASAAQAERGLDAAVAAIRAVEASMSLFREDSELRRLNRDGVLAHPSAALLAVLRLAQQVARRSGGAFDVSVQPLWAAYARAAREGRLPGTDELVRARAFVGWQGLAIDDARIAFKRPGMALTLNGIAQGHAADAARAALQAHGIAHALLDTGEWSMLGSNSRRAAWTLGIEDPRDEARIVAALRCDGRSIATSADRRSAFTPDLRHHHIIDPATGASPPQLASVTVAAASAALADALTKVMFIAGPDRIPALARAWRVGVLWVDKAGRSAATPDLKLA
jgi:thiamine biosynthesis lipoprotein